MVVIVVIVGVELVLEGAQREVLHPQKRETELLLLFLLFLGLLLLCFVVALLISRPT